MVRPVTTQDLENIIASDDSLLLDCRPSAAYNGWRLGGEARGGHVPGAVSFPSKWFDELDDKAVCRVLDKKGVTADRDVVVTGYNSREIEETAGHLEALGYASVGIHADGMPGWFADQEHQVQLLPRYRHLVHPAWVKELVEGGNPEPDTIDLHVLAHVNFDNWGDYNEGHMPGAIWLDTLILEDEKTWNRRSPEELEEELCGHGITRDTCVVLYGRTANPDMSQPHPGKQAGQIGAMRAAAILLYAGVKDVRVLDGGLRSWIDAGGSVTSEETSPAPVETTGMRIPEHPEYMIDMPEAKRMLADPNAALVSMRSWPEYIGEVSGYHYIPSAGRIPGSVFGNCGSDAYHMENYRNHDDTMLSYHEIEANWRIAGITHDKSVAFYCGTGWRGSEAFFYAWLMGWEHVAVFDGGWYEWSAAPDNPVETGIPPSQGV